MRRPYLPDLSTTGLRTSKDTSPLLANGVIPVIILLKSPIFHVNGIRENGKSGVIYLIGSKIRKDECYIEPTKNVTWANHKIKSDSKLKRVNKCNETHHNQRDEPH